MMHMRILWLCICHCMSVPLCSLLVIWVPLLWIEDQSLSINETGKGIWGNPLHLQQIIFQVDRSQGGARIARVAHSPLPHQPATTTYVHLNLDTLHLLHFALFLPQVLICCFPKCTKNCIKLYKCFGYQCYCVRSKGTQSLVQFTTVMKNSFANNSLLSSSLCWRGLLLKC